MSKRRITIEELEPILQNTLTRIGEQRGVCVLQDAFIASDALGRVSVKVKRLCSVCGAVISSKLRDWDKSKFKRCCCSSLIKQSENLKMEIKKKESSFYDERLKKIMANVEKRKSSFQPIGDFVEVRTSNGRFRQGCFRGGEL